jgi:hypothetical protein
MASRVLVATCDERLLPVSNAATAGSERDSRVLTSKGSSANSCTSPTSLTAPYDPYVGRRKANGGQELVSTTGHNCKRRKIWLQRLLQCACFSVSSDSVKASFCDAQPAYAAVPGSAAGADLTSAAEGQTNKAWPILSHSYQQPAPGLAHKDDTGGKHDLEDDDDYWDARSWATSHSDTRDGAGDDAGRRTTPAPLGACQYMVTTWPPPDLAAAADHLQSHPRSSSMVSRRLTITASTNGSSCYTGPGLCVWR